MLATVPGVVRLGVTVDRQGQGECKHSYSINGQAWALVDGDLIEAFRLRSVSFDASQRSALDRLLAGAHGIVEYVVARHVNGPW